MPALMKIRSAYSSLPTAERKVADFILENPERASLMVINDIADAAGVSVPSVTRIAKKLGYNGFLDFRVSLASGTSSITSLKTEPITEEDSDKAAAEKVFLGYMRAMEDTMKSLDYDRLGELADRVARAKRIFLAGTLGSVHFVQHIVEQFHRMGLDAMVVSDPAVLDVACSRVTQEDVFIAVSRSGRTKLTINALKQARSNGCYCAYISNYVNSTGAQYADAFFCTSRVDDLKSIAGVETNTTMNALMGALIALVVRKQKAAK